MFKKIWYQIKWISWIKITDFNSAPSSAMRYKEFISAANIMDVSAAKFLQFIAYHDSLAILTYMQYFRLSHSHCMHSLLRLDRLLEINLWVKFIENAWLTEKRRIQLSKKKLSLLLLYFWVNSVRLLYK